VAAALQEVHRRSPRADVVVAGYLTYWRPGGCYPADPYHPNANGMANAAAIIAGAVR
jgi:hypothetical protein